MNDNRLPTIFSALILAAALAAPAANAADDIEAKLQVCSSCHGANGVPTDPKTIPIIWGQTQVFLVKQLHDYRAADRDNPTMAALAKTLSQEELRPAAAYFEKKPWPARQGPTPVALAEPKGIEVCQACHQKGFVGGMPAPRLVGQTYEYLISQMNAFASGARTNNMDMVKIMQELSPADREGMAHYIASL